jgi:hypothetical protein
MQLLVGMDGTWQLDRLGLAGDTNIGRGLDLFRGSRLYVPGVGTGTLLDRLLGGAAGWRARRRVRQALEAFSRDYAPRSPTWIGVEGYSRGAIMAIEFCRVLAGLKIRIDWLGLYDPVQSMLGDWPQSVSDNVEHWLALYATHERRRTFWPTLLQPDRRGRCVAMPGAHGDVGGQRGEPSCAELALHRMVRERIRWGGESEPVPYPPEPMQIRPARPLRLLPARPRGPALAAIGALTHRWLRRVTA